MTVYNTQCPHESLGNMTPHEYRNNYYENIKKEDTILV